MDAINSSVFSNPILMKENVIVFDYASLDISVANRLGKLEQEGGNIEEKDRIIESITEKGNLYKIYADVEFKGKKENIGIDFVEFKGRFYYVPW